MFKGQLGAFRTGQIICTIMIIRQLLYNAIYNVFSVANA